MAKEPEKYVCALCGYTANGRFRADICPDCGLTYWKCNKCGFLLTCYIPECGGPGHIDPRL